MAHRYLFGPMSKSYCRDNLGFVTDPSTVLTFGTSDDCDIRLSPDDTWDSFAAKFPADWQADVLVLFLPYTTFPPFLWQAPLPIIGLAGDWNLLWHYYRRSLAGCDLVFTDKPGVELLDRAGLPAAESAYLYGLAEPFLNHNWSETAEKDIDILFVGFLNPAIHRERFPWLARIARLSERFCVRIEQGIFGDEYRDLTGRAKIAFNRTLRKECNKRVWEAVAAGAVVFVEADNREIPEFLEPGKECVVFHEDDLEELLIHYLTHEDERAAMADAARAKWEHYTFRAVWQHITGYVERQWDVLKDQRAQRTPPGAEEMLLLRCWQVFSAGVSVDKSLLSDLANMARQQPSCSVWYTMLGLISVQTQKGHGSLTSTMVERAINLFGKAVSVDASDVMAQLNLAEAFFLANRKDQACRHAEMVLELLEGETDEKALTWQCEHFPLGYDLFRVEWEKAAWQNAGNLKAETEAKKILVRYRCHILLGELTGQLHPFYEAVLCCPDLPVARAALGCALARVGQFRTAVSHLQQAVQGNPFDNPAAQALSGVYQSLGRTADARDLRADRRLLHQAAAMLVPAEEWFAEQPLRGDERTSIIILCCNELEFTRMCLDSVLQHTRKPFELILIDNGSTDGTPEYLNEIRSRPEPARVEVIRNEENLGFAVGCNQGLAEAQGDFLVLLNNDTVVTDGWLEGLIRWSVRDWPHNGLVGAVTNYAAAPQEVEVSYQNLDEMHTFAKDWKAEHAGQAFEVRRLIGFCILMRRDVWDKVGNLDERFGLGFFEDDDWGLRVREEGFRLLVAKDVFIHHFGSRTFVGLGIDRHEQLQSNFKKFEEKWGKEHTVGYRLPDAPAQTTMKPEPVSQSKPAKVKVSLTMIVKNEEAVLERCLQSARDLVEEIIVVDTGSTDSTKAIAESFGAKVIDFTWVDSFSAARNESIHHATGEWVLWLDADEWLDDLNRDRLRKLLANLPESNLAFVMRQSSPLESGQAVTAVDQVRLFRNLPGVEWRYRVHEQILLSLREHGAEVAVTDIVIAHSGFSQPTNQSGKVDRNLRLLEREVEEQPEDAFVLYNLGAVFLTQGRTEEALSVLQKSLDHSQPQDTLTPKLYALLVRCYQQGHDNGKALEVCRQGRKVLPDDAELLFWEGVLLRETGDADGCIRCLEQVLSLKAAPSFTGVDEGLHGYRTRHLLAETLLLQNRSGEAEAQWETIVREHPHFHPAWEQLVQLRMAQQKWQKLEEAVHQLRQDTRTWTDATLWQGQALLAQKEYARALDWVEEALGQQPDVLSLRILRSHIFLQQNTNLKQTEQALLDVLALAPNHAETQHNLAVFRSRQQADAPLYAPESAVEQATPAAKKTRPGVSLCLIVKNEEDNLADCLQSAADLVEEIIVVDTGSEDRTKEIAVSFGAKVFDFPWVDSFCAARNESLRHAGCDWIFWLDADDRLDDDNRQKLKALFAELPQDNVAYVMKCLCLPDPVSKTSTVVDHIRLFPNRPDVRWRYRIHEQILPSLRQAGAEVRWSDVTIRHTGYQDPDLRSRKLERDLRLLRIEYEEQPDDPFTLFNLGSVYREQGKQAEAIPLFRRSLDLSQPSDSIVRKLYTLLAQCQRQLDETVTAQQTLEEGLAVYPDDPEILFQQAVLQRETGDSSAAEATWLRILESPPDQHFASVDIGLRTFLTRHNLALLYREQDRTKEAMHMWQAALEDNPDYGPALIGLCELFHKENQLTEAEALIDRLQSLPGHQTDAEVLRARCHMVRGHFDRALEQLQETIDREPDALWPRIVLSHALLQQGKDWQTAERALREILRLEPDNKEAENNLAVLKRQQKQEMSRETES